MDPYQNKAEQAISDIFYRTDVRGPITEPTEAEGLANYVAMTATHVSRAAVNNRWCAVEQQIRFMTHHEAVLPACRKIVRDAVTGHPERATDQLAALFREADAAARARLSRSLITSAAAD